MIEHKHEWVGIMCTTNVVRETTPGRLLLKEWAFGLNVASPFPWTINTSAPENEVIVQSVATHEALHAAGVGHALHSDPKGDKAYLYCTRSDEHAAMTMYPCTPIRKADTGGFMTGGRSNYWPYTLGYGDMNGLMAAKP